MPAQTDNLQLALTLDLKPFLDGLKNSEKFSKETVAELQKMFGAVEPIKVDPTKIKPTTEAVTELKNEVMKYATVNAESAQSVAKFIESEQLSEKVIRDTIDSLQKERSELAYGSQAYLQNTTAIKNLENGLVSLSARQGQVAARLGGTTQAVTTLSYIVRDSPFFFQRFDMGIMATSNNLNPFIDQMLRAREMTGSWRGAVGSLTSGLIGFGGLSFAFSLIVAAIQAFSFIESKAKRDVDNLNGSLDEQKNKLEKASYETIRAMEIQARMKLIEAENAVNDKYYKNYLFYRQMSDEQRKKFIASDPEVKNAQEQLDLIIKYKGELGLISQIENKITELREKQKHSRDPKEIAQLGEEIKAEQKKLDVYIGTNKAQKDSIITFSNEIRAEIQHIDVLLKGNTGINDRISLLEKRKALLLELTSIISKYLEIQERGRINNKIPIDTSGFSDLMQPVAQVSKPEMINESNLALKTQLALVEALTEGYNSAGRAVAAAMGNSIHLFKQNNSLLQIFISELIKATIEALALKAITAFLNIVTGGISGIFGGAMGGGSLGTPVPDYFPGPGGGIAKSLSSGDFIAAYNKALSNGTITNTLPSASFYNGISQFPSNYIFNNNAYNRGMNRLDINVRLSGEATAEGAKIKQVLKAVDDIKTKYT